MIKETFLRANETRVINKITCSLDEMNKSASRSLTRNVKRKTLLRLDLPRQKITTRRAASLFPSTSSPKGVSFCLCCLLLFPFPPNTPHIFIMDEQQFVGLLESLMTRKFIMSSSHLLWSLTDYASRYRACQVRNCHP
jgi:hypothetical protein